MHYGICANRLLKRGLVDSTLKLGALMPVLWIFRKWWLLPTTADHRSYNPVDSTLKLGAPMSVLWIFRKGATQAAVAPSHFSLTLIPKSQGGTHIFGQTGMCRSNGSLFYKKSLNMDPVFYQKILKHGSTFLTELKFSGFRMAKTPKIVNLFKNWPIFQEKSLKMGTLSYQNNP